MKGIRFEVAQADIDYAPLTLTNLERAVYAHLHAYSPEYVAGIILLVHPDLEPLARKIVSSPNCEVRVNGEIVPKPLWSKAFTRRSIIVQTCDSLPAGGWGVECLKP